MAFILFGASVAENSNSATYFTPSRSRMSWDHLSELNDGHHVSYAYSAGQNGGPPCGYSAKLGLAAVIELHGELWGQPIFRWRAGALGRSVLPKGSAHIRVAVRRQMDPSGRRKFRQPASAC